MGNIRGQDLKDTSKWLTSRMLTAIILAGVMAMFFITTQLKYPLFWVIIFFLFYVLWAYLSFRMIFEKNLIDNLVRNKVMNENRRPQISLRAPLLYILPPVAYISIFPVICAYLYRLDQSLFYLKGLQDYNIYNNAFAWMGFAIDQTARAVCFDFFETFKWDISNIDYSDKVFLSAFIFLYKTILGGFFWGVIARIYNSLSKTLTAAEWK